MKAVPCAAARCLWSTSRSPPVPACLRGPLHLTLRACRPAPPFLQNISDEDVLALVNDEVHQPTVVWVLEGLQVGRVCGVVWCGVVWCGVVWVGWAGVGCAGGCRLAVRPRLPTHAAVSRCVGSPSFLSSPPCPFGNPFHLPRSGAQLYKTSRGALGQGRASPQPVPSPSRLAPAPARPCRWCAAPWACPPPQSACGGRTASRGSPPASAAAPWTPPTRWGPGVCVCVGGGGCPAGGGGGCAALHLPPSAAAPRRALPATSACAAPAVPRSRLPPLPPSLPPHGVPLLCVSRPSTAWCGCRRSLWTTL